MTLRLGFVGVGRWSRKLAESFRACGAEVVAHDRGTNAELIDARHPAALSQANGEFLQGFGYRQRWRAMLNNKNIDAIVAVAPPEVTTEVALACAAAGKPVMATKPLFDHPERVTAPFYVDLFRLWSDAHLSKRARAEFVLWGSGPFRSFPGSLDYGPHVMAALLDIDQGPELLRCSGGTMPNGGEFYSAVFRVGPLGDSVGVSYGNGGNGSSSRSIWGHEETATHIGDEPKEQVVQKMCRAFISDVQEGFVDPRLLRLSRDGMALLERVRREAK